MAVGFAPACRGVLLLLSLAGSALPASGARADDAEPRLEASRLAAAPTLSLSRLGGGRVSLDESRGRVRLVHFFATWCGPCRPELESLDRLRAEAGGLEVLAVSIAEPQQRLQRFFAERPVGFPVLLDRDRAASRAWEVDGLPSTVVVDVGGRPRLEVRGVLDWQGAAARAALDELLRERPEKSGGKRP